MSNEMRALVKAKPQEGLWMERRPVPEIGPDDVLIRINKTGICGTDIHIWNWDEWAARTVPVPLVTGHEFAGEIVELGRNVTDLKIGQRCSGEGHLIGHQSRQSRSGKFHLDPETRGIGVNEPGAFAEYLRLPAFNVVPLPDEVDDEIGAILDPLGNAVHTALSFDLIGEDVLITGAGPIGLMAAAVVRQASARHVVITDVNDYRLELARRMGVSRAVDARTTRIQDVQTELGMREGFDVALEMSGNPTAFREMLDNMAHGGRIAMLGIPSEEIAIDWNKVVFNMLTIKGIYGRQMYETWYMMTALLQSGLDISPVITHRFDAADYEEAFAIARSGNAGKVVLRWNDPTGGR